MVKNNNLHAAKIVLFLLAALSLVSHAATAPAGTGNRIWDEGLPTTYTWNSFSFAGFYYDLDGNLGTEELTISNIKRTIGKGDILYKTSPIEISFEHAGFGKFQVIGFMADKYFAGYTKNSVISNNEAKSGLGRSQLQKVLLDDDEKRTVSEGGTLTLKEGYVLKMKEVDIGAGPGQILVSLLKDGVEVDTGVVSGGNNYVYSKKVGSVDMQIIAVHFDAVFRGREVNAAFLRGAFQLSEAYTPVKSGDRYSEMEISSVSGNGITMTNRNPISLSSGNTIDLMGDMKIVVADSDTLRFAPSVERPGIFEVRGTVYPVTDTWTPLNFGMTIGGTNIGFYYDMDKNTGNENLKIESISSRTIPEDRLRYSTTVQDVDFDFSGFGKYQVIGFMAERYFAGYTKNSVISNKEAKSVIGRNQLHRVLLDDDTKRVVSAGATLTFKDGYVLKMKDIDIGAGQGQILVALLKDGAEVDTGVIAGGENYIYSKKVGSVSDMPIIAVHFDSVFRGRELNAAFTRGVFQISEAFASVKNGDRYGIMKVSRVGADGIEMRNDNGIGLSSGSIVDLMGNIKFRVADSGDVRFYPFVTVTPEMVANQLSIDAPARATVGDAIRIRVTAGGKAVEGAAIAIDSEAGQTDKDGILNLTLAKTLAGMYNITATKLGYQKASKTLEVQKFVENMLTIQVPSRVNQFETITILVTFQDAPVRGADVAFDNLTIGQTDSAGTLRYAPEASGTHTLYASKSGYITAARDVEVRIPFSEFKALDINISPKVILTNQNAAIRSNITNVGTKGATLPVVLIINSTEVDTRPVTLAPGETKEISFVKEVSLPAGNYTVEILGQKDLIEVREGAPNILLIVVVITVIGLVVIYLLTRKRKQQVDKTM